MKIRDTARGVPLPLDREDRHLLDFACRWLPFGGARSGDVLVEFGLTPAGYRARVAGLLSNPEIQAMVPSHIDLLRRSFGDARSSGH
ncbi:DUF3263 domain-containing protein [Rhodococcus triatomae]|nr:hypothetical protein G419_22844 [Rhodococcus triatomae BKS 15-14]